MAKDDVSQSLDKFMEVLYASNKDISDAILESKNISVDQNKKFMQAVVELLKANQLETKKLTNQLAAYEQKRNVQITSGRRQPTGGSNGSYLSGVKQIIKEELKNVKTGTSSFNVSSSSDLAKTLFEPLKSVAASAKKSSDAFDANTKAIAKNTETLVNAGSKINAMFGLPNQASSNNKKVKVPGEAVAAMGTNQAAELANKNNQNKAIDKLGNNLTNLFLGKKFWGMMLTTIVDGIFKSKLLAGTLGDIFKLGFFLLANLLRNTFGKQIGGTLALLTAGVGSLMGIGAGIKAGSVLMRSFGSKRGLGLAYRYFRRNSLLGKIATGRFGSIFTRGAVAKGGSSSVKKATKQAAKQAAKKGAAKGVAKTLGKTALKKIPGVGLVAGLGFAGARAASGDYLGAIGELASGVASTIPGAGTAVSLGIDALLGARDMGAFRGAGAAIKGAGTAVRGAGGFLGKKFLPAAAMAMPMIGIPLLIAQLTKALTSKSPKDKKSESKSLAKISSNSDKMLEALNKIADAVGVGDAPLSVSGKGGFFSRLFRRNNSSSGGSGKPSLLDKLTGKDWTAEDIKNFENGHAISSEMGYRKPWKDRYGKIHPGGYHYGIDQEYKEGDKVAAKLSGKVVGMGDIGAYGHSVVLDHGDSYALYAHLSAFNPNLKPGQSIKRGTVIGLAGHSGGDYADHLHYEIRTKKKAGTAGTWDDFLKRKGHEIDPKGHFKRKFEQEVKAEKSVPVAKPKEVAKPEPETSSSGSPTSDDIKEFFKGWKENVKDYFDRQPSNPKVISTSNTISENGIVKIGMINKRTDMINKSMNVC